MTALPVTNTAEVAALSSPERRKIKDPCFTCFAAAFSSRVERVRVMQRANPAIQSWKTGLAYVLCGMLVLRQVLSVREGAYIAALHIEVLKPFLHSDGNYRECPRRASSANSSNSRALDH